MGAAREGSLSVWVLRKLERHLYRAAARIVVLMPRADAYICRLGIPREKIVWIPNGAELSEVDPAPKPPNEGGFTLMYFGAHGRANGLDNILAAMGRVRDMRPDLHVRLRLIGDGPLKPDLIGQAKQMGLDNVVFEPPVPKAAIPALAAEADAFVVNLVDSPIYHYGISLNKLFDYLAAGRPIVFAGASVNNPVAEAGAGISVPPGDAGALAKAVVRMASLPAATRAEMGRNAHAYVRVHHDFRVLARRLADCLDAVVAEQPDGQGGGA
jgi:glycosyltransferase involved in cell wall biosynthesis